MRLFGLKLNLKFRRGFFKRARPTRDDILVWGTVAALAFLAFLILWDGYLFYVTVFKERERRETSLPSEILTSGEVEEAIEMLDEQKRRFEQIFGAPL